LSVEPKRNGALRLRCDGPDCERKFVPIWNFTAPRELRKRAALYGWSTAEPVAGLVEDVCPECRRASSPASSGGSGAGGVVGGGPAGAQYEPPKVTAVGNAYDLLGVELGREQR
jgi:hypothetical protein